MMGSHPRRFTIALLAQVVLCLVAAPVLTAQEWAIPSAAVKGDPGQGNSRVTLRAAFDASNVRPEEVSDADETSGRARPAMRLSKGALRFRGRSRLAERSSDSPHFSTLRLLTESPFLVPLSSREHEKAPRTTRSVSFGQWPVKQAISAALCRQLIDNGASSLPPSQCGPAHLASVSRLLPKSHAVLQWTAVFTRPLYIGTAVQPTGPPKL